MALVLLRAFTKMDEENKISIPSNIRKELKLTRGDFVELKVQGTNDSPHLLIYKRKKVR